jgi:hypothetical protein
MSLQLRCWRIAAASNPKMLGRKPAMSMTHEKDVLKAENLGVAAVSAIHTRG